MDHLTTNQERKDRWYARKVLPKYLAIQSIDLATAERNVIAVNANDDDDDAHVSILHHSHACYNISSGSTTTVPGIPASLLKQHSIMQQYMQLALRKHGFVVIQHVLDSQQCQHAISLAWDYIEAASLAEQQHDILGSDRSSNEASSNEASSNEASRNEASRNANSAHSQRQDLKQQCNQSSATTPPVRRGEPSTYTSQYYPRSVEGKIFPYYGSGHSNFMWYIRSIPNVQQVFASIYNTDIDIDAAIDIDLNSTNTENSTNTSSKTQHLKTSLDGLILWNIHQHQEPEDRGWFHIDQNPISKPDFCSYQGLVNVLQTTASTGGNIMIANSHLIYPHHYTTDSASGATTSANTNHKITGQQQHQKLEQDLFYTQRLKEINGDDWLEIDPRDTTLLPSLSASGSSDNSNGPSVEERFCNSESNCVPEDAHTRMEVIMCLLGAGDMIVWDSRTVHCSHPGEIELETDTDKDKSSHCNFHGVNALHMNGDDDESAHIVQQQHQQGLVRLAGLVNMVPEEVLEKSTNIHTMRARRLQAVESARTLTHWVDKCAPLGEERSEDVLKEKECVKYMKQMPQPRAEGGRSKKVLLSFDDLTDAQRNLI